MSHLLVMDEISESYEADMGRKRGFQIRAIFIAIALLLFAVLVLAWVQRNDLADSIIRKQLAKNNIQASYRVEDIGLRTQKLSNVVIGDPAHPDLTIKTAEIDVAIGFSGAVIRNIRADGIKLQGRYENGIMRFGELDKLRDLNSKKPIELPDYFVDVTDATLALDTPWGAMSVQGSGKGALLGQFKANLSGDSAALQAQNCTFQAPHFSGILQLENQNPHFIGPVNVRAIKCKSPALTLSQPRIAADVQLSKDFSHWIGDTKFTAQDIVSNGYSLKYSSGALGFNGNANRTEFTARLDRAALSHEQMALRQIKLTSQGALMGAEGNRTISARGDVSVAGGALSAAGLSALDAIRVKGKGTPFSAIIDSFTQSTNAAASNFDGHARYDFAATGQGPPSLVIDGLGLNARSGAQLSQKNALRFANNGKGWLLRSPIDLAMRGGDLPTAHLALRGNGHDMWQGSLSLSPIVARDTKLALSNINFSGKLGGDWIIKGQALASSQYGGAQFAGLRLPIEARLSGNGFAYATSCQNISFDSLQYETLRLGAHQFRLCPDHGKALFENGRGATHLAASIVNFKADGTLGQTPLSVNSQTLHYNMAKGFDARGVSTILGSHNSASKFQIAALSGHIHGAKLSGSLSGGAGQIGQVPLLLSDAKGDWVFAQGKLMLDSVLKISDAAVVPRFQTLESRDMALALEHGVITANGSLNEPRTGHKIADATITHALETGIGRALLNVDDLQFDPAFQPNLITPLTLGVIANVQGAIKGAGQIDWNDAGVTSSGKFSTDSMDLAAAFGPVQGLSSEIIFTDLLGLETAPHQIALIQSVNPGIETLNGKISYQLLAGNRVQIEGGQWPFAGGQLLLEPTILDFDIAKPRRLTFRVVGMDAEKFLYNYDFKNLRVSGVFDGELPMIFDSEGGRIVGGELISRDGGGELSYIGELTYADMGAFPNFAFNALKSIRFHEMKINVDGNVDGEIITKISFAGVQQGSYASRNFFTRQLARIPIKFNVSISAQFLQLIGSIRGLYDPAYVNRDALPELVEREKQAAKLPAKPTAKPIIDPKKDAAKHE